ncbi:MAG TPA: polysaccharide deacetylase family protein [Candidatus Dormibacteraeota bacterium]|nr:polysaccharide deacetylase family protein [Candidatus Dormibacteraeota bacterium]
MRAVTGRVLAALVVVVAAGYLLQVDDSVALHPASVMAPAVIQPPILVAQADAGGREWRQDKSRVVPLGYRTLMFPILMYHYIRTPPSPLTDRLGYNLSIAPRDFQAQMDWLLYHGYHPVDFNDIRAYFAGKTPLPARPVVITLDDGYADLYTAAYPILRAHEFKAVAYIVSGFVGRSRYVTQAQIVEMDRHGIEIGAHTVDHADLARASQGQLMFQIVQSKHWLEQLVGHPVIDFAYPSGRFSAAAIAALEQTGYSTAVTELWSTIHSLDDRYVWTRIRVSGGENLTLFVKNLGPTMPTVVVTTINVPAELMNPDTSRPGY